MEILNDGYIKINDCSECKGCCSGISEIICGINMIKAIQKKEIPEELIQKMRIYRVSEENLNKAAKIWGLFPLTNLLKVMTLPTTGFYEFLALPSSAERCIFLSDNGCLYPDAKPFECGLYPFYIYKMQFRTDFRCKYSDNMEDDLILREFIGQYITDYLLTSHEHKKEYYEYVKYLKPKYNLPEFEFH